MKTAIIWGVVLIVILIGGYFGYKTFMKNPGSDASGQAAAAAAADSSATTDNQVQAQEVTIGTGTEAVAGATVSVLYVGKLPDGTVFDSSEAHGNEPLTFVLGEPGMIPGFQIGVNGMKEGGERLMAIPPELAYGDQAVTDGGGNVIIPTSSTLIFSVKLVKVVPASAAATTE